MTHSRQFKRFTDPVVLLFIIYFVYFFFSCRNSAMNINPKIQRGLFLFAVSNSVVNPVIYGEYRNIHLPKIRSSCHKYNFLMPDHTGVKCFWKWKCSLNTDGPIDIHHLFLYYALYKNVKINRLVLFLLEVETIYLSWYFLIMYMFSPCESYSYFAGMFTTTIQRELHHCCCWVKSHMRRQKRHGALVWMLRQ